MKVAEHPYQPFYSMRMSDIKADHKAQAVADIKRSPAPPLPPRMNEAPPPYEELSLSDQWQSGDPRSSSTQSLVPDEAERNGRRTLLLIYIHGFMGNETSFQSFPAHVHNLLSITLSETHTVHTKIYPRYKSRKAIEFARNDFSKWLEPHENAFTDTILLGHSLGGILAAEVALMPSPSLSQNGGLNHRLLGTISFDTPFLGMHPGVIVSGIGSLFRPAPEPPGTGVSANSPGSEVSALPFGEQDTSSLGHSRSEDRPQSSNSQQTTQSGSMSPLSRLPTDDPNYNPPFPNDVRIVERKGWNNVLHFVNKHADGLTAATKQYFVSHLEFGGCLADYQGLKSRYSKLRKLEDVDEIASREEQRVRFINYYTASTGRPKLPKRDQAKVSDPQNLSAPLDVSMQEMSLDPENNPSSIAEGSSIQATESEEPTLSAEDEPQIMQLLDCIPVDEEAEANDVVETVNAVSGEEPSKDAQETPSTSNDLSTSEAAQDDGSSSTTQKSSEAQLPPLPPIPVEPELVDLTVYTDKDARKIAEKERKRILKAYQQAMKDHESAVKDRKKLVEKREKKARQEQEKRDRDAEKLRQNEEKKEQQRQGKEKQGHEKEEQQRQEKEQQRQEKEQQRQEKEKQQREEKELQRQEKGKQKEKSKTNVKPPEIKAEKPKRDKKFCMLPSDLYSKKDDCWIRIYMDGVDEVGAHCGLFTPGKHYENLVGEVGNRVEEWVKEDATRRMVLEMEAS